MMIIRIRIIGPHRHRRRRHRRIYVCCIMFLLYRRCEYCCKLYDINQTRGCCCYKLYHMILIEITCHFVSMDVE